MPQTKTDSPISHQETGLLARAALAVALTIILVIAMHWAMSVTNANAHQISSNLSNIQHQFERRAEAAARKKPASAPPGPRIEPAASSAGR